MATITIISIEISPDGVNHASIRTERAPSGQRKFDLSAGVFWKGRYSTLLVPKRQPGSHLAAMVAELCGEDELTPHDAAVITEAVALHRRCG